MEEKQYRQPDQRKLEVLRALSAMGKNGVSPSELASELGIETFYAAVLLSTYKRQGILLKRKAENGRCRYCLSPKGERKLAYFQSLESGE